MADEEFEVTGIGRSYRSAMAFDATAHWAVRDIPSIFVDEWRELLADADVVVNAWGAVLGGARDDLEAIHVTTLSNLTEAAAGLSLRIVQISAAGASTDASTAFLQTKAQGDQIVARAADWAILRPVTVIAPEAYGTALLRAGAALPLALPRMLPDTRIQTISVADSARHAP